MNKTKIASKFGATLKLMIILIVVTLVCSKSIADEELQVVDVLEEHDIYTYCPNSRVNAITAIRNILPQEVTAVLNDGSRIELPVERAWGVKGRSYENSVAKSELPEGVSDEQGILDDITVQSRPYSFVQSSLTLINDELRVETRASASVVQLYRACENNAELVADSSDKDFARTATYGAFKDTGATPANFDDYIGTYYEPSIRTGRNLAPVYVAFPGQVIQTTNAAVPEKVVGKVRLCSLKKSKKKLTLSWKKVSGAAYYEVYVKVGKSKFKFLSRTKKLKYTHRGLKKGQKYTYKVRAVSSDNKRGAFSSTKSKKI